MSLLIKALASAEKDKQAEINKRHGGERIANAELSLEIVPEEIKKIVEQSYSVKDDVLVRVKDSQVSNVVADNSLTLEEEAGLGNSSIKVNKLTKPKQTVDKAKSSLADSKGNSNEVQLVEKSSNNVAEPLLSTSTLQSFTAQINENNPKAAAKVFVANQSVKASSSKYALVMLGIAGVLMILVGLQGYSYFSKLIISNVVVKPSISIQSAKPVDIKTTNANIALPSQGVKVVANATAEDSSFKGTPVAGNQSITNQDIVPNIKLSKNGNATDVAIKSEAKSELEPESSTSPFSFENVASKNSRIKKFSNSQDESNSESDAQLKNGSQSSQIKLISKTPTAGVDPILLSAYQAFNRGEDIAAQQQYRQVLQHDVRNVDALLGMAAIAQRQNRDADAMGWYQKVLEIEPRNTIALSAILSPQSNTDVFERESRIKSMLAQQPDAANLYAALGNLYVEQNQWPSAQAAYFDASRLAPNNADYAFNLAISLDQLGKSSLALKQYQRALDLLNKSGASSPNKVQLEARIQALQ